jgi:hypothetical protein
MASKQDNEKSSDKNGRSGPEAKPASRKPYVSPVLVEYGTIAKLTQGSKTMNTDGVNSKKSTCL